MVVHLAFHRALDDHFRQLPEQPAPAGEPAHQLLASRRQLELGLISIEPFRRRRVL
jgi:hypothetical protein